MDLLRILSKKGKKSLGRSPLQELEEGTRSGEARGCQEDRQPDLSLVPGTPGHLQRPRIDNLVDICNFIFQIMHAICKR